MDYLYSLGHTFPLMRGGAILFIIVGLGIIAGAVLGKRLIPHALIAGAIVAFLSQAVLSKLLFVGLGKPSLLQWIILGVGLSVEVGLVNLVVNKIPDRRSREFWLWMLVVVGAHFLIFGFSHGPLAALLGLLCIINAGIGLLLKRVDYRLVLAGRRAAQGGRGLVDAVADASGSIG
jgi:hypothetical protein